MEEGSECSVKVVVRCRPLNEREVVGNHREVLEIEPHRKEISIQADKGQKLASYFFDSVFGATSTQQQVYQTCAAEIVEEMLAGYNCTIFAYGQTGTGKTFTMEGKRAEKKQGSPFWYGSEAGLIPRAVQHIFQHLEACSREYSVHVSYLELYNEELIDLLCNDEEMSRQLVIRNDAKKGTFVQGLEEIKVINPEEIFKILEKSAHKRTTAETLLNKVSSRSHCIFTITVHTRETTENGEDLIKVGRLNLVDLAGSENVKRSGAQNERFKEAASINTSLLTLGRVINELAKNGKKAHIPYRDSKLTRLLQESLGGRSKTCIIATISPSEDCLEETRATLKYATMAKGIKNKPVVNQKLTQKALIKDYVNEIESLKNQLFAARTKEGFYVPQEQWNTMHEERARLAKTVEELTLRVEERQEELEQIRTMFVNKQTELDACIKLFKETKEELASTTKKLQETSDMLNEAQESLEDQKLLVNEHKIVGEKLRKEGIELIGLMKTTTSDIAHLHNKIDRKKLVEQENKSIATQYTKNVQNKITSIQNQLDQFKDSENQRFKELSQCVSELNTALEKNTGTLKQKAQTILTEITASQNQVLYQSRSNTEKERVDMEALEAISQEHLTSQLEVQANLINSAQNSIAGIVKTLHSQKETMSECLANLNSSIRSERERVEQFCSEQAQLLNSVKAIVIEGCLKLDEISLQQNSITQSVMNEQRDAAKSLEQNVLRAVSSLLSSFMNQTTFAMDEAESTLTTNRQSFVEEKDRLTAQFAGLYDRGSKSVGSFNSSNNNHTCAIDTAVNLRLDQSVLDLQAVEENCAQLTSNVSSLLETNASAIRNNHSQIANHCSARQKANQGYLNEIEGTTARSQENIQEHHRQLESYMDQAGNISNAAVQNVHEKISEAQESVVKFASVQSQNAAGLSDYAIEFCTSLKEDFSTGATPARRTYRFTTALPYCRADEDIISARRNNEAVGAEVDEDYSIDKDTMEECEPTRDNIIVPSENTVALNALPIETPEIRVNKVAQEPVVQKNAPTERRKRVMQPIAKSQPQKRKIDSKPLQERKVMVAKK